MTPEQLSRIEIDKLLASCGWIVQDRAKLNFSTGIGIAVREWPLQVGPVDYLLFVNRTPLGVIEAKPIGTTLSGVAEQSTGYLKSNPKGLPPLAKPMRFHYESTGEETFFRDRRS